MLAAVLVVALLLFVFLGAGLQLLVTPAALDRPLLTPVLSFVLGQALFAVVNVYTWSADLGTRTSLVVCLLAGGLVLAFAVRRDPALAARRAREVLPAIRRRAPALAALALAVGVLFLPAYQSGISTAPYRTGIDQVGYTVPADALLRGATRSSLQADLRKQTGSATTAESYERVRRPISVSTQVSGEFLLVGLRRAYSQAVATVALLTGADSVWQVSFLLPGLATLAIVGLVAGLLRCLFGASRKTAVAGAWAVALNCNLLNIWYEGGYGQTWVAPTALLATAAVLSVRRGHAGAGRTAWGGQLPLLALLAICVAGILPTYSDMVTALAAVFALVLLLDVCVGSWRSVLRMGTVLVAAAAGGLLCLPYTAEFLRYAPERYADAGVGGFWQAHWATPAEIAGLWDMYEVPATYAFVPMDETHLRRVVLLSLAVMALVNLALRAAAGPDRRIAYAMAGFIGYVFFRTRFELHALNYSYFKAYTYLLPGMTLLVVGGVAVLVATGVSAGARPLLPDRVPLPTWARAARAEAALLAGVVVVGLVGGHFVHRMRSQDQVVTAQMMDLASDSRARKVLADTALVLPVQPGQVQLAPYMVSAIVPFNWVNRDPTTILTTRPDMPVAIASVEGVRGACLACLRRAGAGSLVLDRSPIAAVGTGLTLRQVTDAGGAFSLDLMKKALLDSGRPDLVALFPPP